MDPLEQVRPRHGSDVGAGRLGVAHGQRLDLGDEQTGELLDDGGVDDEALRRDAALPGVEVAAPRGHLRDAWQVGVGQDDERVRPPSSSTDFLMASPAAGRPPPARSLPVMVTAADPGSSMSRR